MKTSRPSVSKRHALALLSLLSLILLAVTSSPFARESADAKGVKAPPAASQTSNAGDVGKWSGLIPFKTVPVHISLLPNGKLLYWGRDKVMNGVNLEDVRDRSNTYVVDPADFFNSPLAKTDTYLNATTNLFCSGHSFLPDGRLLVTGGHDKSDAHPYVEGLGEKDVNIFDYRKLAQPSPSPWTKLPVGLSLGRWYPFNATLANGDVAILGGSYWVNPVQGASPQPSPTPAENPSPEKYVYDPRGDGSIAQYTSVQYPGVPEAIKNYPLMHLLPNNQLLVVQPTITYLFDGNGTVGRFTRYGSVAGSTQYEGSSALYDVANGNAKILVMGGGGGFGGEGSTSAALTNAPGQQGQNWTYPQTMAFKRKYHTATVLPDGKVLVSGGTQCPGANDIVCAESGFPNANSGAAVINPELWDPEQDPHGPLAWKTMAPSLSKTPRVYHSIALLLPDATVLVGGGGLPGAAGEIDPATGQTVNPGTNHGRGFGHMNAEIFSPPYLFDSSGQPAERPVITSLQTDKIGLGQSMQVGFSSTQNITSAVLVRLGSVTHGTNQDQRRVRLNFTASGNNLNVSMPATGGVCPPGPYMLFLLNQSGTPSVAKILTVTTEPQALAPAGETIWVGDNVPAGGSLHGDGEGWNWISSNPAPFSGTRAHQSNAVSEMHQHYFDGATDTLTLNTGDSLIAYVYLDPANPPREVMLQWYDGSWAHRAYWGENLLDWGENGRESLWPMGGLPEPGRWVRLEVPARLVGLEGRTLTGMAFTLVGGRATWDHAGKYTNKNAASAANGAVATASSEASGNFRAEAAINGDRKGASWGAPGGGWNDASQGAYSQDWVRVDFDGPKSINEIDVYTLSSNYSTRTTDPDLAETFSTAPNSGYGITSFDVQYLSGSGWVTVDCGNPANPCGRVYDNDKVRQQFIFAPVVTSAVRVAVHGAVQFTGPTNYSRIVEIEAYHNGDSSGNLALNKTARQSSTYDVAVASRAVDGNRDGTYANGSVTHTNLNAQPWWEVDLGASYNLDAIRLSNRTDCCGGRLSNFHVFVSDQPFTSTGLTATINQSGVFNQHTAGAAGPTMTVNVRRTGRYVRVQLAGTDYLSLAEVEVMGAGRANVARSVAGSTLPLATASSTAGPNFPASAVNNGDRQGRNWGNGGGWNDGTEGQFASDWLMVTFNGTKTINEIDVYTLRDGWASRAEDPTPSETFSTAPNSGYGITSFDVQYLNGGAWVNIPGGRVVTNNNVWRKFNFNPISTTAIRVVVRDGALWTTSPVNYSRLVEVEAWEP